MNDSISTKICSKCKVEKSVNEFGKRKDSKDGLKHWCNKCASTYASEYRRINKETISEHKKKYHKTNKVTISEHKRKYRQANKETISKRKKIYNQANKVEISEYNKGYHRANKEESTARIRKYSKTEQGKNAHKKANHKRRSLKLNATIEDFSPVEVFERDKYICQTCGIKTRPDFKDPNHPKRPQLDHIVPLSLGGEHSKRNTQCLCRLCNMRKHNTGMGDQMRLFG